MLKLLSHLEYNLSQEIRRTSDFKTDEPMEIIRLLSLSYQALPIEYFFESSINDWQQEPYSRNRAHEDQLIFITNSGIKVRSKSERIIADILSQSNLVFRYDAELILGGEALFPDFTIRRPFDGSQIIWEHLGLMDNSDYKNKANRKMALYFRHDYRPFFNLICTYERDMEDTSYIQNLVQLHILSK